MLGAGGQKRVPDLYVKDFEAAWPPTPVQSEIVAYLDVEIARIDALVSDKKQLTQILREFRDSVIRTETSGINRPGGRRETGNQFMPTVPEGWGFIPVCRYATITNGSTPLKDNLAFWQDGNFPWLNTIRFN